MLRAADYCRMPAAGYPSAFGHGGGGPQPDLRVALLALAFGKPEEMGVARRATVERFGAQPILRIGVENKGERISAVHREGADDDNAENDEMYGLHRRETFRKMTVGLPMVTQSFA